ncbi:DUF2625 domain-containing protein [Sphingobacterium sp. SRCM116780]|uniref:DUF2625 domain-containing protein n=1 Tax=Sphingobacterium sp. SRCM116780 TaxID=2907623 RepID=UPI001F44F138|nr:DUF2625 domain-containing protein [Sphingobacterium sp. SRCM116780]UIR54597.1 DUF2625 domain-containing protein [Sphingobacterium sp. SRCM116780]
MKTLKELINKKEPGWDLVKGWMKSAKNNFEILPRNPKKADEELLRVQISTKSPMGAIIFETGGILIDKGWLRILGSGSHKLNRGMMEWNKNKTYVHEGEKGGFLLIADDILGGYFAINAGELGDEIGKIYYFAPDTLKWESLGCGYSDFVNWSLNGDIALFYKTFKWNGWEKEVQEVDGNQVFSFFPNLWTKEGKDLNQVSRKLISVEEHFNLTRDLL